MYLPGEDAVLVWDVMEGRILGKLTGLSSGPQSVAVSPDGKRLAASCTYELAIWDTGTLKRQSLYPLPAVAHLVAFLPNGVDFVSFGEGAEMGPTGIACEMWIWDGAKGVVRNTVKDRFWDCHDKRYFHVSPDGKLAFFAPSSSAIHVVDLSTATYLGMAGTHRTKNELHFSGDFKRLARFHGRTIGVYEVEDILKADLITKEEWLIRALGLRIKKK